MKIKWLGHACFLITTDKGIKIITDPYEAGFRGIVNYDPVKEAADIVTISHQHGDHNYVKDLKGSPELIQGKGKHQIKGIGFIGISSYHDRVSGQERGNNTIFCFTVDDIKICHCGDLGHPLDDEDLYSLGHVDLLLVPIGGPPPTLELHEAINLWGKFQPSVIIPMHFRNEKCTFPKYGIEDLLRIKPEVIRAGKSEVQLTADHLPSGQILTLDPAL